MMGHLVIEAQTGEPAPGQMHAQFLTNPQNAQQ